MKNFEGAFRVNCEIIFNDRSPEEGKIGFCVITRPSPHIENDKLSLLIHIWDKTGVWRNKSYNALRDAAISGNQFLHFCIDTEPFHFSKVLAQLRHEGFGPTINIRQFVMWPKIILPKAPTWAWRHET